MDTIRNIIFDLGGVLYNIDPALTTKALQCSLGMEGLGGFFSKAAKNNLFERFEKGEISEDAFREEIRHLSGLQVSNQQIDQGWNAMLLDMPAHHIELLEGLKGHYRLFLLSNTNAIHYPFFQRYMHNAFGFDSLDQIFEKTYLSHKVGMRKPHGQVFELIINENALVPEETLFIDDTHEHVVGARGAGLKAIWLDRSQLRVTDLFNPQFQLRPEAADLV